MRPRSHSLDVAVAFASKFRWEQAAACTVVVGFSHAGSQKGKSRQLVWHVIHCADEGLSIFEIVENENSHTDICK
jgi:hypothetical protein